MPKKYITCPVHRLTFNTDVSETCPACKYEKSEEEETKDGWQRFSAFTVAELDRMIAVGTHGKYACVDNEDGSTGYEVSTQYTDSFAGLVLKVIPHQGIMDDNSANCRAKMLIYLIENNLLTL